MSDTLAPSPGRLSPGRRIVILVWAMILMAASGIAGFATMGAVHVGIDLAFSRASGARFYIDLVAGPLAALASIAAAVGAYVLLVRLAERRWPSELAPASALPELGRGIALAVLAFGLLMGVLTLSGGVVWRPPPLVDWRWALASGLSQGAFGGLLLGLVVQGGIARLGTQALGPAVGVVLAALAAFWILSFDVEHPPIQRANAALGGAILALVWLRRRRLWLGLGLFMGWGALVGAVIGGYSLQCGYDSTEAFIYEPGRGVLIAWLRGEGGPESSVPLLAGCVLAVVWLAWRAWKEGRFSRA